METRAVGPLAGYRVLEIEAIGPGPFAAMLLGDLGADVLRIDRPPSAQSPLGPLPGNPLERGRHCLVIDLKDGRDRATVMRLVQSADVLIEGFRPGVAERLGIGPDDCLAVNPRLVYGRMTGWGQDGPLSNAAGHDLNYIALSGMLHAIGRAGGPPVPPLNLLGDFGGGGLLLAFGVVAALLERQASGCGQVIDAAMAEGAALLGAAIYGAYANGSWSEERGTNVGDTGSHFYETYETADGKWISVAAVEPQFYVELSARIGLDPTLMPPQMDRAGWPEAKRIMADVFRSKTRDEWCQLLEGTDACFAPVLSMREAPIHPQNQARRAFVAVGEVLQPAPAPRFSRTPLADPRPAAPASEYSDANLRAWGLECAEIARLAKSEPDGREP